MLLATLKNYKTLKMKTYLPIDTVVYAMEVYEETYLDVEKGVIAEIGISKTGITYSVNNTEGEYLGEYKEQFVFSNTEDVLTKAKELWKLK